MKNTIVLLTILVTLFCIAQTSHAASGGTHAIEGMVSAKYSGAPSQTLAGQMGLFLKGLKNDMNILFNGTISNPDPLKKLGYKDFSAGDKIQFTRTGKNTFKIKHMDSGKEFTLKVVS